ncbi:hypothetical protein HK100_003124 [Physocladia obscura]|uniref:CAP-Gly domain-containing protein n=1 Tax=Physocladia obscura TaxID=109957 RepID=A0AAD5T6V9_9FUNG|nr:hypothetical protein HK100_003124 [Physocladia obscura]
MSAKLGDRVEVTNGGALVVGTVRFMGVTGFASGIWFGIELDGGGGKNDGSIQGTRYFDCPANAGVFMRAAMIKRVLPASKPHLATTSPSPPAPAPIPAKKDKDATVLRLRSPSPALSVASSVTQSSFAAKKTPSSVKAKPSTASSLSANATPATLAAAAKSKKPPTTSATTPSATASPAGAATRVTGRIIPNTSLSSVSLSSKKLSENSVAVLAADSMARKVTSNYTPSLSSASSSPTSNQPAQTTFIDESNAQAIISSASSANFDSAIILPSPPTANTDDILSITDVLSDDDEKIIIAARTSVTSHLDATGNTMSDGNFVEIPIGSGTSIVDDHGIPISSSSTHSNTRISQLFTRDSIEYLQEMQDLEGQNAALEGRVSLLTNEVDTLKTQLKKMQDHENTKVISLKQHIAELEILADWATKKDTPEKKAADLILDLREQLKTAKEEAAAAILKKDIALTDIEQPPADQPQEDAASVFADSALSTVKEVKDAQEQLARLMTEFEELKQRLAISEANSLKAGQVAFDDDDSSVNDGEAARLVTKVSSLKDHKDIKDIKIENLLNDVEVLRAQLIAFEHEKAFEIAQRAEAYAREIAELKALLSSVQNENERLLQENPMSEELLTSLEAEALKDELKAQMRAKASLSFASELAVEKSVPVLDDDFVNKTEMVTKTDYDFFFMSSIQKQATLTKENGDLREQIQRLFLAKETVDGIITKSDLEKALLQDKVVQLTLKLQFAEDSKFGIDDGSSFELASLRDELEALKIKYSESEKRFKKVEEEKMELYENMAQTTKSNETLREKLSVVETELKKQAQDSGMVALIEEVEDLRFRLKAAESKRATDRDQNKEIGKLKEELGSATFTKSNTADRVISLQSALKVALSDKEMLTQQLLEANDALELVTLDYQLSEERYESVAAELQNLKDEVEELNMDLDFVVSKRPEIELNPEQFEGVVTEINLLNNQNERLKDALVQFRDFSAMREKDLGGKIQELESEISKLLEQQENDSLVYLKLVEAESQIEDLKDTLNGADETKALAEFLKLRNLELSNKIETMRDVVEDMEILQDLTDELEENHVALEKELIDEIDIKDGLINNLRAKVNSQEETIADYERTIHNFRELVQSLQEEVWTLGMQGSSPGISSQLSWPNPPRDKINLMDSAGVKAQYKGIDIELRKLDVAQSTDHLEILKVFLPDTFFKTEHVPILSLLLLRRVVFKCNMIKMFLEDNFLSITDPEEIAFIAALRHKLFWAMGLARRLVSFLEGCADDVFLMFGSCYTELIGTERKIDVIIDLLKIEEVIGQPGVLVEMQNSEIDLQRQSLFYIEMVDAIGDRFEAEMRRLEGVFIIPPEIEDINVRDRIVQVANEFLQITPSIAEGAKSLRIMIKKLRRMVQGLVDEKKTFTDNIVAMLGVVHQKATISVDYLSVMTGHIGTYVREQFESKDSLSLPLMNQLASNASDALLRIPEDQMGISLVTVLARTNSLVMDVVEALEDPFNVEDIPDSVSPPWYSRATKIKSDYLLNKDLSSIIESLKADIFDLVADLNEKKNLQIESNVKIEYLEKKSQEARTQTAMISMLEGRVKKLMENERGYIETVELINYEKGDLERENEALKQNALRYEKMTSPQVNRRLGNTHSTPFKRSIEFGGNTNGTGVVIDGDVATQFESLKSALRFLRMENTKLKADLVAKSTGAIFKTSDPLMRRGLNNQKISASATVTNSIKLSDVASSVVSGVTRDSKNLLRDIHRVMATPSIVDISARDARPGKWVSMKADPMFQHQRRIEEIEKLVHRGEDLQDSITKVSAQIEEATGRTLVPKSIGPPTLLGRVTVPKIYTDTVSKAYNPPQSNGETHRLVLTSRRQWEELHSMFSR